MIARCFDFKSSDNKKIADKIYYTGCEFIKAAFTQNDPKGNEVQESLWELMLKLSKVISEMRSFEVYDTTYKQSIVEEVKKGIVAIPTLELARCIENFLTQSIGALDIFATQFLKILFNYSHRDFNHIEIIKHLNGLDLLDKEAVQAIKKRLEDAWDNWLRDFNQDRNLHHQENFGLSLMSIVDGKPYMVLTRRNGIKTNDVWNYLIDHWNKIFWLIENMIRLSFWAFKPNMKVIFFMQFQSFTEDVPNVTK